MSRERGLRLHLRCIGSVLPLRCMGFVVEEEEIVEGCTWRKKIVGIKQG